MQRPSANSVSENFSLAWAKQATYLPDFRRNTADNWSSSLYIRNDDAQPRTVKVTYLNADGSYNTSTSSTLNANALWINTVSPNNWQGAAIVDGNEDLSVVAVQERNGTYTHEAYAGVGNPATDVLVPLVHRHNGLNSSNPQTDWNSDIFIVNSGGASTNVTLQFIPAPGAGNSWTFTNYVVGLAPGARSVVNVAGLPNIGVSVPPNNINGNERFVGSVRITASQPLAIASTQYNLKYNNTTISQLMESSNSEPAAAILYAPLIQNNNSGWLAGLNLSRTGSGTFDVRYYRNDTGAECINQLGLVNNPQTILPAPPAGNSCPTTPSAKLQVSSGAMVAAVNQLQGAANASTYPAIATPSKVVIAAKVRRDTSNGWNDALMITNFNTVDAEVVVRIYNMDGTENGSSPAYNNTLYSGRNINVFGSIPVGFVGSAVVTSNQPVAVQVNSWKSGGGAGDTIGSYPGNHR